MLYYSNTPFTWKYGLVRSISEILVGSCVIEYSVFEWLTNDWSQEWYNVLNITSYFEIYAYVFYMNITRKKVRDILLVSVIKLCFALSLALNSDLVIQ